MVFQVPATPHTHVRNSIFLHFGSKCKMDLLVQHSNTMYETRFFFHFDPKCKMKIPVPAVPFSSIFVVFFPIARLYTQFFSYFLSSSKFFSDCTLYVSWEKNFFFPCFSCYGVFIPISSGSSKFSFIHFADCHHTPLCQFYS